jgi:hypothetical protein
MQVHKVDGGGYVPVGMFSGDGDAGHSVIFPIVVDQAFEYFEAAGPGPDIVLGAGHLDGFAVFCHDSIVLNNAPQKYKYFFGTFPEILLPQGKRQIKSSTGLLKCYLFYTQNGIKPYILKTRFREPNS